jgi:tripartite-type tricarboxylate transporter receptor subunit TctC
MAEVPTIAEAGVSNYEFTSWFGMFAPAGTPREVVAKLHAEAARIMAMPDIRQRLPAMGNEAVGSTPEQFSAKYKSDIAQYANVVKEAGVPPAD